MLFYLKIVFLVSYYCVCSVTLPRGAIYRYAVYDCGISWSYCKVKDFRERFIFAEAKFSKNKTGRKWQNLSVAY